VPGAGDRRRRRAPSAAGGPLGSGKTRLARQLARLLPELGRQQALEVTQVASAAGLLG
jgi:predicted ATPase with chaperone activity